MRTLTGYPDRFLLLTRAVRRGRSRDDLSFAVVLKRAGISLSDNIRRPALFSASIFVAGFFWEAPIDLVLGRPLRLISRSSWSSLQECFYRQYSDTADFTSDDWLTSPGDRPLGPGLLSSLLGATPLGFVHRTMLNMEQARRERPLISARASARRPTTGSRNLLIKTRAAALCRNWRDSCVEGPWADTALCPRDQPFNLRL